MPTLSSGLESPRRRGALQALAVPPGVEPMEAKLVDALPEEPGWQFEPKWDGFRCLAFRAGDEVELRAKSGKPLTRYFPEVAQAVRSLPARRIVLDGELAIAQGGHLSFEALQLRLHPAESRIRRLADEHPAMLILFDCLMAPDSDGLVSQPLSLRRAALELFYREFAPHPRFRLSPTTNRLEEAEHWLERVGPSLDGVVAKRLDGAYQPGARAMLKVKRLRTADCVVGGFRYLSGSRQVGSLLLGLYDWTGRLNHVGFTATISDKERPALTRRLQTMIEPPGFTGSAPGGPSRWATERTGEWEPLRPELVVEVRYDHISGGRFRHGTRLVRWRPDKAARQCDMSQMQAEARPGELIRKLIAAV
jgi:ATP-dependent DNA ligase